MAVYIFDLLTGYLLSGVEHAQGYRARMLRNHSQPVKFVFTELPSKQDIDRYKEIGMDIDCMLSMHQYLAGNHSLKSSVKAADKIPELQENLHCTDIQYLDAEIRLIRDGSIVAELLLDEPDKTCFYAINYFNHGKLLRTEYYTEALFYAVHYVTAKSEEGLYAKKVRHTFYHRDGSIAYEQIWKGTKEQYLFPDGRIYTQPQFVVEFIKKLDLSEKDIIFMDRGARRNLEQPLFQYGGKARIMTFFHSAHYFEEWEEPEQNLYLNDLYLYWFKYSNRIDTMVVSTQGQKEELIQRLKQYDCVIPKIAVIPVAGLDRVQYPQVARKKYSIVTVSRLDKRKRVDWIVKSVIKAHQKNCNIFIDIYGGAMGESNFQYLQEIIYENNAQSYVTLKGYGDVTEVYQNYEVYFSASLSETYGLSLMEAVGSGTAMIGLDVKYGNRLFIRPEKNGYLIDFAPCYVNGDDSALIDQMAEKIVKIFADEERLDEFHKASYSIAQEFLTEKIAKRWKELLI